MGVIADDCGVGGLGFKIMSNAAASMVRETRMIWGLSARPGTAALTCKRSHRKVLVTDRPTAPARSEDGRSARSCGRRTSNGRDAVGAARNQQILLSR